MLSTFWSLSPKYAICSLVMFYYYNAFIIITRRRIPVGFLQATVLLLALAYTQVQVIMVFSLIRHRPSLYAQLCMFPGWDRTRSLTLLGLQVKRVNHLTNRPGYSSIRPNYREWLKYLWEESSRKLSQQIPTILRGLTNNQIHNLCKSLGGHSSSTWYTQTTTTSI
jgi:hypothetical protein